MLFLQTLLIHIKGWMFFSLKLLQCLKKMHLVQYTYHINPQNNRASWAYKCRELLTKTDYILKNCGATTICIFLLRLWAIVAIYMSVGLRLTHFHKTAIFVITYIRMVTMLWRVFKEWIQSRLSPKYHLFFQLRKKLFILEIMLRKR